MDTRTTAGSHDASLYTPSQRQPSPISFGENEHLNVISREYESNYYQRGFNKSNADDYNYRYHHPYRRGRDPYTDQYLWKIHQPLVDADSLPQMQIIRTTTDNDVLCGRGGGTNNHPGNRKFRFLVKVNQTKYLGKIKKERPRVADEVVEQIRKKNPPGRFLKKDPATGFWYDIGNVKAREKASQALREGACSIRKSGALLIENTGSTKREVNHYNHIQSLGKNGTTRNKNSLIVTNETTYEKAFFDPSDLTNSIVSGTRKALPWVRRTFKEIQFEGLLPHYKKLLKNEFSPPRSSS
eukprot:CAMPEP_0194450262 /NCGR_PEP_ID=MMETSP0176-20130528/130619_1 /TAXON_ID=216777 /ORGANISM="Proboscia alata, Strain PI-D3" /LENGTH=296 /DNA_ID=CAMNT_0039277511 /DNA_START=276 /DNA_END=1163 /DNA_ORIENTATION=+